MAVLPETAILLIFLSLLITFCSAQSGDGTTSNGTDGNIISTFEHTESITMVKTTAVSPSTMQTTKPSSSTITTKLPETTNIPTTQVETTIYKTTTKMETTKSTTIPVQETSLETIASTKPNPTKTTPPSSSTITTILAEATTKTTPATSTITTKLPEATTKTTPASSTITTKLPEATTTTTKTTPAASLSTKEVTKEPPTIQDDLINSSGVSIKLLEISVNEFKETEFQLVISDNTREYCINEENDCQKNAKYVRPEDVIIYHKGTKPYNKETDVVAATASTHVSLYVKDPYNDLQSVMDTEQATTMLEEQQSAIEKQLGYNFEIKYPYVRTTGFPGWATSLIVFLVICVMVVLYVYWRTKKMEEKKLDAEIGVEKGTQATQAEIIAEINRQSDAKIEEKLPERQEASSSAVQAQYIDIITETGAPVVKKYLNKSLKDNKKMTDENGIALQDVDNGKQDDGSVDDKNQDDLTPLPPPPPPVEFSEVDVHSEDWQKEELPEPPRSPFDMDVAAEEATSELVNLVKEQTIELENSGIINPAFTTTPDGTVMTEL